MVMKMMMMMRCSLAAMPISFPRSASVIVSGDVGRKMSTKVCPSQLRCDMSVSQSMTRTMTTMMKGCGALEDGAVMENLPSRVRIVEVGPRDGLQNEKGAIVSVEDRVRLILGLIQQCNLDSVEVGSFVSKKWVPQMANSDKVLKRVIEELWGETRRNDESSAESQTKLRLPVLAPNMKGFDLAVEAGAREVAIFAAASEGFSTRNINCSVDESLRRYKDVCVAANEKGVHVRGYVSTVVGCPIDGDIKPSKVAHVTNQLIDMGCYEVSLGDTIGVGTPGSVHHMLSAVLEEVPRERLAVHFHDTFGMAASNILMALQHGISVVDSAVAGLGGCPYAPGAGGNVATEDVVYMLNGMGVKTGIDLNELIKVGDAICEVLQKCTESRVAKAMRDRLQRKRNTA